MIFIVQYLEADNTFVVTLYMVGGFLNWSSLQNKQQQNCSILDFTTPEHHRDVMFHFKIFSNMFFQAKTSCSYGKYKLFI